MPDMVQPYPAARETDEPGDHKERFRGELRKRRLILSIRRRPADAVLLSQMIRSLPQIAAAHTVAAYVAVGAEPPTDRILWDLDDAGKRLLLPVLGPGLSREWAVYQGANDLVVRAPGRPPEPSGPTTGPETIADAQVIIVPALAVDTSGTRLGQGGGWYDRVLRLANPNALIVAVVYDNEVYDSRTRPLPREGHDQPVAAIVTPSRWIATEATSNG